MPLAKQLIPVDIVAGLDTKNDPKLTPKLTDLKNGRYTVGSQISKRLGYSALSQNISGTTDLLSSGDGLTSFQDELLEFSNSRLYSYSSGVSRWTDMGGFQSVKIDSDDVVRNTSEAKNQDSCIASGLTLYAWESYNISGALEGVYASVIDATSGAVFQAATLIDATAMNPRCLRLGPNPTLFYLDTSSSPYLLKNIQVDINNPISFNSSNTIVGSVNPTNPNYDIAINSADADAGNAVFAYNSSTSTTLGVGYITTDGVVGGPANGYPPVVTVGSTNSNDLITVCTDQVNTDPTDSERIYVAYSSRTGSQGLKVKRFKGILTIDATHTVEASATQITGASIIITQAGDLQIIYTMSATNKYDYQVKGAVYDVSADSMGSVAIIKRSVGLASRIWEYDSVKYFVCVHDSALQPTYFICNTAGLVSAKILPGTAGTLPAKNWLPTVSENTTGVFRLAGLVRTRLISKNNDIYSLTGVSDIEMDFTSVERFEAAELGGNLHVGGGFVSMYDSQQIVELNYHLYPENMSAVVNNSSGSLAAGTYLFSVIWFWTDAKGQDHRSAPSVALSATTTGGSSTVTLTIPSLRLTQKTDVVCEVYRTVDAGRLLFKVGKVDNNTAADSLSFADAGAISDANLVAKQSLYTNGGIIENIPPPASLVLTSYKNRLVCVSSENPKKLLYSKKRTPLGPVEFSDVFSIVLNKAVRITALAEFDQKLIVFEPNQIFYITGNGPTSTGAQNDFSPPQVITGDVGCSNTNSMVLMPLGLMFQSNKGIYLLDRSLQTVYIGAEVEAYNDLTITSAELIQNENQIRYLTSDGRCLVYDYFYGKWSTWTNHQGNGATIWQGGGGDYVYLRTDGRVFQQSATSYKDDNDPVEMSLTTSWVKTNGIQGFQRIRRALVLGDFKSTHTLQLECGFDYQDYFNELHKFNYMTDLEIIEYGDSTPYGLEGYFGTSSGVADGVYQFRAHLKKQKCQSVRFRISDVEESDPGQAYSISSLMLEVGVRSNTMKLPAQKLT
tara:strand:+ start:3084 stop:6119 length:3036 start_codon:yes stop_codon:yes gene_type:complete